MPPKNFIEEKEKEFKQKLQEAMDKSMSQGIDIYDFCVDFIRSALDQYRDEVRRVVENEKLPPTKTIHDQNCIECREARAYNAALSDLLSHSLLSKTKEEK